MLSSYETRLILERMEKEIRFLKALLGDPKTPQGTLISVTPEMSADGGAEARTREAHLY